MVTEEQRLCINVSKDLIYRIRGVFMEAYDDLDNDSWWTKEILY